MFPSSVCGNLVVMITVIYRDIIRTARNILIFNLALSDLLLGKPRFKYIYISYKYMLSSLISAPDMLGCSDIHMALQITPFMQVRAVKISASDL